MKAESQERSAESQKLSELRDMQRCASVSEPELVVEETSLSDMHQSLGLWLSALRAQPSAQQNEDDR